MNNRTKVYNLSLLSILTALVFISSMISIPIYFNFGSTPTRVHIGNAFCLLSSFIIGPINGGIVSGLGSMLYDLTNPLFIHLIPFTFLFKFLMAYVCGKISHLKNKKGSDIKLNILAGILGMLTYIILYITRSIIADIFFKKIEIEVALINLTTRIFASSLNAIIAIILSIPLNLLVRNILYKNSKKDEEKIK